MTTTEGLDPAAGLLAAIVQHNVDSLAHTTDLIIASERAVQVRLAEALIRLVEGIEAIPLMTRSVYLDELAYGASVAMSTARRVLDRPDGQDFV